MSGNLPFGFGSSDREPGKPGDDDIAGKIPLFAELQKLLSWSGGPVNAFSLWKPDAVKVTAGKANVAVFKKTPLSERTYCSKCGGHLMTNHPPLGLVDVFAATLPTLKFSPGVHVNYAETVLRMKDGLPKLKDFPKEFGGSGEAVPE